MKQISAYREITGHISDPSITTGIGFLLPQKEVILEYMKSIEPDIVQARAMQDHISGKQLIGSVETIDDGAYYWTSEEIYHFEKYDLKLNTDFIDHVLSKS